MTMTAGDVLRTCAEICQSFGKPTMKWLSLDIPQSFVDKLNAMPVPSDQYVLILSNSRRRTLLDQFRAEPGLQDFSFLLVDVHAPSHLAPLLSLLCSALLIDGSIDGMELQTLMSAHYASARGCPVLRSNADDEDDTLIHVNISHVLPPGVPVASSVKDVLAAAIPTSRFPFHVDTEVNGNWHWQPEAPGDFLISAPEGSPRHQLAVSRVLTLVASGLNDKVLMTGTRYYAIFVGDLCTAIQDAQGNTVVSVLRFRPPKFKTLPERH